MPSACVSFSKCSVFVQNLINWRSCIACISLLCMQQTGWAADPLTFEKHVRPILKAHCFHCHGEGDELQGKLDLRLKRLIEKGGDSGSGLMAGKPAESLLLKRIKMKEMPPNNKVLPEKDIAVLEQWIASGAATAGPEPE
ncbi:MAG: Planctomycete cytochrome, partial [Planctomycetaceae bacterium]|nr:Planctomycete cytochrome [Planctomycetaceae bacterium]